MELDQRHLLLSPENVNFDTLACALPCNPTVNHDGSCPGFCFKVCPKICKTPFVPDDNFFKKFPKVPPLPPPPPPPAVVRPRIVDSGNSNQKHLITTSMTIVACMIGAALLLGIICRILRVYYLRRRNSRRPRNAPIFFGTQEDFVDADHGPGIDHPIWYINTVGLPQSVIDSIAVFNYKKGAGLIEGTECSVCLSEFQDDETLRLLPKCSHAFHMPCIDTWLRSHKNCPLCRAPIVSGLAGQVGLSVPNSTDSSSGEDTRIENSDSEIGSARNPTPEDASSEVSNEEENGYVLPTEVETNLGSTLRNHFQAQIDLVDGRQLVEAEPQPVRRSVSWASSPPLAMCSAVTNVVVPSEDQGSLDVVVPSEGQGNSDDQSLQPRLSKSTSVLKQGSSGNSRFQKMIKISSMGLSLQKGPISMKRSSSSTSKSSSARSRSQDSIFPL